MIFMKHSQLPAVRVKAVLLPSTPCTPLSLCQVEKHRNSLSLITADSPLTTPATSATPHLRLHLTTSGGLIRAYPRPSQIHPNGKSNASNQVYVIEANNFNARILRSKTDELECFVSAQEIDVKTCSKNSSRSQY